MRITKQVGAMLSAVAILVGGVSVSAASASEPEVSDKEIVQGLLFGTGEFAEQINNDVVINDAAASAEYLEGSNNAIDAFFEAEGQGIAAHVADIRSGDINRVDAGLDKLAQTYTEHVKETVGEEALAEAAADQGVSPQACGFAIACVAYAALAIHNTVAITALAAAVVGGAVACGVWWVDCSANSAAASTQNSRAAQENFVLDVAMTARR